MKSTPAWVFPYMLPTIYCLLRQRADLVGDFLDGFAGDVDDGPSGVLLENSVAVVQLIYHVFGLGVIYIRVRKVG